MVKKIAVVMCLCLLMAETSAAKQNYPTAGVSAHMAAVLYNAWHDEYKPPHTNDEVDLLARLITAEQGYYTGADYEEKAYVCGSVVINRVNDPRFPDTLEGVIYQPGQYQCVDNGHINREYDEVAFEIAAGLLEEGTDIPPNVVFGAEFKQGTGVYKKIGNTYFCYG